jgi:hypothetical protein
MPGLLPIQQVVQRDGKDFGKIDQLDIRDKPLPRLDALNGVLIHVEPGIRSVGITAPQDCRKTALLSFMKQSLLFLPAWSASLLSCLLVFGLFCKAWRLGLAVSRSPKNCYTAFPDGRIVRVSRVTEELPRTLYRDAEGNLYRPSSACNHIK